MDLITVNQKKCTKCGLCIIECPAGLFTKDETGIAKPVDEAEKKCFYCGHCISICHGQAISLPISVPEKLKKINSELNITVEQAEQFLKGNRSVRLYKEDPVPKDIIHKIMDITRYAPSAKNAQPLNWIITENREVTRKLADFTAEGFSLAGTEFLTKVVDIYMDGKDIILRGAPHIIIAHAHQDGFDPSVDCSIALTYFDLAANAYGLGTCWAGFFMIGVNSYQVLSDYLKLPQGHKVYGAMMFGYPKYRYQLIPERKQPEIRWM